MVLDNQFISVGYEEFDRALKNAKESLSERMAWRVPELDATQCEQFSTRCYVTDFGSAVAIARDGTILSLCRHRNDPTPSVELVESAKEIGGLRIDCYAGFERLYLECGFEEVGRTGWDDRNAPHDWRPEYGKEDIISFEMPREIGERERERVRVAKEKPAPVQPLYQENRDQHVRERACAFIERIIHMQINNAEDEKKFERGLLYLNEKLQEHETSLRELSLPDELRQGLLDKWDEISKRQDVTFGSHDSVEPVKVNDDIEHNELDGPGGR